METMYQQVRQAAAFIKPALDAVPCAAIVTGTGLSDALAGVRQIHTIEYDRIPHFPSTGVQSHTGCLVYGQPAGKPVLIFQGRCHLYEGHPPDRVVFPVRLARELGISNLFLCNAAGGINPDFTAGDIMVIRDHINLTGKNPLTGPDLPDWGPRFPDMTKAYDPKLLNLVRTIAKDKEMQIREGVYAGLLGPSLETPAETRMLKTMGADAVGFSTVMETIAGVHGGLQVLGLSLITNINAPDHPEETTLEGVIRTARKACPKLEVLLTEMIRQLPV